MQFLYVFSLIFLSVFGLAVLILLGVRAFLHHGAHRHDVYVRSGEDIGGLVESVRRSPYVGRVIILSAGNDWDEEAERVSQRYTNVFFLTKTER